jgi:hypothetical protein
VFASAVCAAYTTSFLVSVLEVLYSVRHAMCEPVVRVDEEVPEEALDDAEVGVGPGCRRGPGFARATQAGQGLPAPTPTSTPSSSTICCPIMCAVTLPLVLVAFSRPTSPKTQPTPAMQHQTRLLEVCVTHVLDAGLPRLAHRVRELVTAHWAHWAVTDTVSEQDFRDALTQTRDVRTVYLGSRTPNQSRRGGTPCPFPLGPPPSPPPPHPTSNPGSATPLHVALPCVPCPL